MNAAFFALTDAFTSVETAVPFDFNAPPPQSVPQTTRDDNNNEDNDNDIDADLNLNMNENLFVSVESVQLPHRVDTDTINNNLNIFTSVESVSIPPPVKESSTLFDDDTEAEATNINLNIQRVTSENVTGFIRDNDSAELRGIMFDTLPSKQKLVQEDDAGNSNNNNFPILAPSFPVLEPEMSGAGNILRDARK